MGTKRREVLLLFLTHALAFTVPMIPLFAITRQIWRGTPWFNDWPAEAYSGRVARIADAATCYQNHNAKCKVRDAEQVLGLGARWVGNERGAE